MEETDIVNNPVHYQVFPDKQAVDIIKQTLSHEEYIGYLKGNILKYRLRAGKKSDAATDIAKADWYERDLIFNCMERGGVFDVKV